ncbi:MAG: hypothetical protein ACRDC4_13105 [Plesiomonas sp.]
MKISNDQNRIELDDGTVLVAKDSDVALCDGCHFDAATAPEHYCEGNVPCWSCDRKDNRTVIFIKEQPNA